MKKYLPGDKVKIREDLEIGVMYGGMELTELMVDFLGQETIIEKYHKPDYTVEGNPYFWSSEMLEPI